MHQIRQTVSFHVPITRKGTKYVARPLSHTRSSVAVLVAIRDMLHLAQTQREVHEMIKQKLLKVNGRMVVDYHDSVKLFNIISADKHYMLTLTPHGRFAFKETKSMDRPCKVVNKNLVRGNKIQVNCHDGTNAIMKEKVSVHDTIYVDETNKVKKHVTFEKGKSGMVIAGKSIGHECTIEDVQATTATVVLKETKEKRTLKKEGIIVL